MRKLREGGKFLLSMFGTEKLTKEDLLKKYQLAGKEITLNGIVQRLASLRKRKLVGMEKRGRKRYYFLFKKISTGSIKKSTTKARATRRTPQIHDTSTTTKVSSSNVGETLTSMSLDEINTILTAIYPGERITLTHMERLVNFVASHGETIRILAEKGLIPSGSQELSKCRLDNQALRKEIEELSSRVSETITEIERLSSENSQLKIKLEHATSKIEGYVKAERSRVTARAQQNSQVHFGER